MKLLLQYWPIILTAAGTIWWAAQEDLTVRNLQAYIDNTAHHVNNLDYRTTVNQ